MSHLFTLTFYFSRFFVYVTRTTENVQQVKVNLLFPTFIRIFLHSISLSSRFHSKKRSERHGKCWKLQFQPFVLCLSLLDVCMHLCKRPKQSEYVMLELALSGTNGFLARTLICSFHDMPSMPSSLKLKSFCQFYFGFCFESFKFWCSSCLACSLIKIF